MKTFKILALFAFWVLMASIATAGQSTVVGEDLVLEAKDGVPIHATFYSAGSGKPAIILIHMMRRNRSDWADFALDLKEKGFSSLAIDLRGHGQTTKRKDGSMLDLGIFRTKDYKDMKMDLQAAMNYLYTQNVPKSKISIVGASIGANLAINYAAKHPKKIKAVALLSPGLNYKNIKTAEPMGTWSGPVFLTASKDDSSSAKSVDTLSKMKPERCETIIYPGEAHGTLIFNAKKDLVPKLLGWLVKNAK